MNVLMVGAGNPPSTFIQRQIRGLEERGIRVTLLPDLTGRTYLKNTLSRLGLTVHFDTEFRAFFRTADVVHFQWPGHLINYYSLARQAQNAVVLSLRGRQINILPRVPGQEQYVHRLRRFLPRCDAYHCVSADILTDGVELGADPDRAWIVRTAVDTSFFSPPARKRPANPLRLTMIGSLMWRKGYDYALLALDTLVRDGNDIRLTIIGEGSERERIEHTIADLKLSDRVDLLGRREPEQVRDILRDSHVLLHTSTSEGIPNSVVEGLACGLPIVATDAGGVREAVTHEEEGFVVPLRDVAAIAAAIRRLLSDESLRKAMGSKSRAKAERTFDLSRQPDQFVRMYEAALSR